MVKSPLTGRSSTKIKSYSVDAIANSYLKKFNLDVSSYFRDIRDVNLYQCNETSYQFYHPYGIDGDSKFYEYLQRYDWYYMPWKWEHELTLKLIKKSDKILEVGSGGLGFLSRVSNLGYEISGLELNVDSVKNGLDLGLNIYNNTVQEHSNNYSNCYDVVCLHQVLEHISDVFTFIEASVSCLKVGGTLIIAVPNNDSFIRFSEGGILNKPPHHMGLWNEDSLSSLEGVFNLKVQQTHLEPLQDYHVQWYINSTWDEYLGKFKLLRGVNKILNVKKVYASWAKVWRKKIIGHSILITFTKL